MNHTGEASVTVYQRHIDAASKAQNNTPVARAMSERFTPRGQPQRYSAYWWNYVQIDIGENRKCFRVPPIVDEHMRKYLQTGEMEPFSFTLCTVPVIPEPPADVRKKK